MLAAFYDGSNPKKIKASVCAYSSNNMMLVEAEGPTSDFLNKVFLNHAKKSEYGKQMLSCQPEEWVAFDILTDGCGMGYSAFHLDPASTRKLGL
jgi:hypothetical protein